MTEASPWRRLHGRRHGKKLKPGRRRLVETLLPRLRVPLDAAGDPAALFASPPADLWLEIGFGGGEHLAAQARLRPDVGFIGCEPFLNGVSRLLAEIEADSRLANIRLFDDDARRLLDVLPDACLGRVFLLFPDPWPKARHAKRRFINPDNLTQLAGVMADRAELRMASDHMGLIAWSLEQVARHPDFTWTARRPADWRCRPADAVETRYEAKALENGDGCVYLAWARNPRAAPIDGEPGELSA